MSIRAVFRVQCDGPGKEWLSIPEWGWGTGRDVFDRQLTAEPTAERAGNWPGERAARHAALGAGWTYTWFKGAHKLMCPACAANPLGIKLPEPDLVCVCGHRKSDHNLNDLCIALPGVMGCGCLGFKPHAWETQT